MLNAKEEFLKHTEDLSKVKAAIIGTDYFRYEREEPPTACLKVGYTEEEYQQFLQDMDFEYDAGYGSQELCGTIWYEDGTWSSRGEYDGSEWWEYNKCPEIDELLK